MNREEHGRALRTHNGIICAVAIVLAVTGVLGSHVVLSAAGMPANDGRVPSDLNDQRKPSGTSGTTSDFWSVTKVRELAKALSQKPFEPVETKPGHNLPDSYDEYRKVKFRRERALWRGAAHGFELHGFPMGWLFNHSVKVSTVDGVQNHDAVFRASDFEDQRRGARAFEPGSNVPISGFRINGRLNSPKKSDEIVAFQGASYFRALGKSHVYGISARGLAIATASQQGEEFPTFRRFWIKKPTTGSRSIIVHALLDSPSATGAYSFTITPGEETVMDVEATLFPRQDIPDIGIAPLTSMHLLSPASPVRVSDFRPRVHDSEGLAIKNANGERIWRPLANPTSLQISFFKGRAPVGFGLVQRTRHFEDYEDLEARYERRPTAWIVPESGIFDRGSVTLIEIPSESEVNDNIVAFWRPAQPLKAGKAYELKYKILWCDDVPEAGRGLRVSQTRAGRAHHVEDEAVRFVVDYDSREPLPDNAVLPDANVSSSSGSIAGTSVRQNPETKGLRVTFLLYPEGEDLSELRLTLSGPDDVEAETWLYRWTRGTNE